MTKFVAIKINYDTRDTIAGHLKYSTLPKEHEYNEHIEKFDSDGVGGRGFHECLNYHIPSDPDKKVQFYIPPTGHPKRDEKNPNEEFVFFSFTYKQDPIMPSKIIGVHAGSILLDEQHRPENQQIDSTNIEKLCFHGESPSHLTTLFTHPIDFNVRDGVYTKAYSQWGYGRRYIEHHHAKAIIAKAYNQAVNALTFSELSQAQLVVINRQILVLQNISERYGFGITPKKNISIQISSLPSKAVSSLKCNTLTT